MRSRLPAILVGAVLLLALGYGARQWLLEARLRNKSSPAANPSLDEEIAHVVALGERERQIATTHFAKELLAEQCGAVLEKLWDALNVAEDKLEVLAKFTPGAVLLPRWTGAEELPHGIRVWPAGGAGPRLTAGDWSQRLRALNAGGWRLAQCEVRHIGFAVTPGGTAKQSKFWLAAHLSQTNREERAIIEGNILVDWAEGPVIRAIDASALELKTRSGPPPFQLAIDDTFLPPEKSYFIDPLLVYDLDGNGLPEIILASANVLLRKRGNQYEREPFCATPPGLIFTGVIGDFDGNGTPDFLSAKFEGLFLHEGSPTGTFDTPGRLVWRADPRLKYAQVLTCGDIDGDGDLDVWLGQYRPPYERGNMPAPWDNANDGNPSYLLLNDGHGNFTDATASAGLAAKQHRRAYSGSFLDLDGDGDLDLAVVSDFAGLDLYRNDGRGHFTEVTRELVKESRAFGMAHVWSDLNSDGRPDLLMIGMNSPTADRLASLGLTTVTGGAQEAAARAACTYGNRLYLGGADGRFTQTALNDGIARTGWAWGASAFDLDNDGHNDVAIANGHETNVSVRDYEPEFWLHDLQVGHSRDDRVNHAYFQSKVAKIRGGGASYGGYEKNRLLLNRQGTNFVETAFLLGVALEDNSRNLVTADLDGDGRMDLLVTTFVNWPRLTQNLKVYRNALPDAGNWIGFRLHEQGGGLSPAGARIIVRHAGGILTRQLVTGDSYRSQHPNAAHFGLGQRTAIESAEIRWVNGKTTTITSPAINQWHDVKGAP